MASTKLNLNIKGHDQTSSVFKTIAANAKKVGAGIFNAAKWGAGAAAGVAVAFGAAAKALGGLSDIAMQAGTTTDELTKMGAAMDMLGVKGGKPEEIASAFQKMAKATGRTGLEGFKATVAEIAKLPSIEERSAKAMEVFGKSGLNFLPLIEAAAQNGIDSFGQLIDFMPGVAQAAANAGDSVWDSFDTAWKTVKASTLNAVGYVCGVIDNNVEGGIRAGTMRWIEYAKHFVNVCIRHFQGWAEGVLNIWNGLGGSWQAVVQSWGDYMLKYFKALGGFIRDMWNTTWDDWFEGKWFGDAPENFAAAMEDAVEDLWQDVDFSPFASVVTDDLDRALEKKLEALKSFNEIVEQSAVTIKNNAAQASSVDKKTGKKPFRIGEMSNAWTEGGTYAQYTMGMRQSMRTAEQKQLAELRKMAAQNAQQTEYQRQIAAAMENIAVE